MFTGLGDDTIKVFNVMNGRNKDEQTSHPTGFHFPHFPGAMEKFETDSKLEFAEKRPKKLSSEL